MVIQDSLCRHGTFGRSPLALAPAKSGSRYGKDCVIVVTETWPTYHIRRAGGLSDR